MHLADLAGAKPQLHVRAFTRQYLHVRARGARELRALAGLHFHAMHLGTDRDAAQGQRVAGLDRRLGAGHELHADADALRRKHVAALAVLVEEKRDMRAAIRVVLEALDLRRDRILVASPVDDPQVVLVAAALMAHGDAPVVVAAAAATLRLGQREVRLALVQLGRHDFHQRSAAWRGRFDFD